MPFKYNNLRKFEIGCVTPDAIAATIKIEINDIELFVGSVQTESVAQSNTQWNGYDVISIYADIEVNKTADIKITALDSTVIIGFCNVFETKQGPSFMNYLYYNEESQWDSEQAKLAETTGNMSDSEFNKFKDSLREIYEANPVLWGAYSQHNFDNYLINSNKGKYSKGWIPLIKDDKLTTSIVIQADPEYPLRADWHSKTMYYNENLLYYKGNRYIIREDFVSGDVFDDSKLQLRLWKKEVGSTQHSGHTDEGQ